MKKLLNILFVTLACSLASTCWTAEKSKIRTSTQKQVTVEIINYTSLPIHGLICRNCPKTGKCKSQQTIILSTDSGTPYSDTIDLPKLPSLRTPVTRYIFATTMMGIQKLTNPCATNNTGVFSFEIPKEYYCSGNQITLGVGTSESNPSGLLVELVNGNPCPTLAQRAKESIKKTGASIKKRFTSETKEKASAGDEPMTEPKEGTAWSRFKGKIQRNKTPKQFVLVATDIVETAPEASEVLPYRERESSVSDPTLEQILD